MGKSEACRTLVAAQAIHTGHLEYFLFEGGTADDGYQRLIGSSGKPKGRLNFQQGDRAFDALLKCGKTPVVMTVYLDRPAILTEVRDKVSVLYADFGIDDDALLDVLSGKAKAGGHLPFALPSSMAAVDAQKSDVPHNSPRRLYPCGYAMR